MSLGSYKAVTVQKAIDRYNFGNASIEKLLFSMFIIVSCFSFLFFSTTVYSIHTVKPITIARVTVIVNWRYLLKEMHALWMDSPDRRANFANEGYEALPFAVPFYPTISDLIVLLCTTILAGPAVVVWCTITSLSVVPLVLTQMYFFISTTESEDVFDGVAFYI